MPLQIHKNLVIVMNIVNYMDLKMIIIKVVQIIIMDIIKNHLLLWEVKNIIIVKVYIYIYIL
jgi:hypothetical protein